MRKILALLLSVMLICSSVGLSFAEGELVIEEEIPVDVLDMENEEVVLQEVLMEADPVETQEDEDKQDQETEGDVLFVDDSVSFDDEEVIIDSSNEQTGAKMYLSLEAGKALFADADLSEVQIVLAEPAVVLGLFQETVYAIEYADAEGVKTAYASAYDVELMDEDAVGAYEASVQDALTVDNFVLMPVVSMTEEVVETAAEEAEPEVSEEALQTDEEAEVPVETSELEAVVEAGELVEVEAAEEATETVAEAAEGTTESTEVEDSGEATETVEEAAEEATESAEVEVSGEAAEIAEEEAAEEATETVAEEAADVAELETTEIPAEEAVEEVAAEEAAVENVETAEVSAEEAVAEEILIAAEETVQAGESQVLSVEEETAELTAEEAAQIVAEDSSAQKEAAEAETATEELQSAEELVVSDEVITEDSALAGSEDDFIYEDPDTKKIIKSYKVDGAGGAISIPATVKIIRTGAFNGNTKITAVSFAGSSVELESGVFQNCTAMTSCALPTLITPTHSVPDGLFRGCSSLKAISITGNNIKYVGDNAFAGCTSLVTASLGTDIETVGAGAFEGCASLVSVAMGDNVKVIGSAAFKDCTSFVTYSMGNKVEKIGESAFNGCIKLQAMTWSAALKEIEPKAFYGCTLLGSVSIPANVEKIGSSAFEGCIGMTDLRFEGTATTPLVISTFAFRGCTGLKSIDLPERLTDIDQGAFINCSNVTTVTIRKKVRVIGEEAFRNCAALTTLNFLDRSYWDGTNTLIIYSYAFTGCTSLTSAMLPARTSRVDKQAFYGDSKITEVEILGNQLNYVGQEAFAGLNSDVWITIWEKKPIGAISIGANAFGSTGDICSYQGFNLWKYATTVPNTPHWVPLDAYLHVLNCYNLILNRNWNANEIAAYRKRFHTDSVTGLGVVESLLTSAEFKVPDGQEWKTFLINRVYQTMLLRTPDSGGESHYKEMLQKGVSIIYVLKDVGNTQECSIKMASVGLHVGNITLKENRDQNIEITHFVTRLYKDALERYPDLGGLNHWTGLLLAKKDTAYGISLGFLGSQEFLGRNLNDKERVKTFYRIYLGREPQGGEDNYWTDILKKGVSDTYLLYGFVHSPEFTKKAADAGIPRGDVKLTEPRDQDIAITWFVKRCYLFALNREPDIGGLNNWCGVILNKKDSYDGVARGFMLSQEMINRKLKNEEFLNATYHVYFDRDPDAGGFATWLSQMNSGLSREKVLDGFSNSVEFANLLVTLGLK